MSQRTNCPGAVYRAESCIRSDRLVLGSAGPVARRSRLLGSGTGECDVGLIASRMPAVECLAKLHRHR